MGDQTACRVSDDDLICEGDVVPAQDIGNGFAPGIQQISSWYHHTCHRWTDRATCFDEDNFLYSAPGSPSSWISAGFNHTCAISGDDLECWGTDYSDGVVLSPSLNTPSMVDVGRDLACALDGSELKCWSRNSEALIFSRSVVNATALEVGFGSVCVLEAAGVICDYLGFGVDLSNVPELTTPNGIAVARDYACAVDGTSLVCWGDYPDINLGDFDVTTVSEDAFPLDSSEWADSDGDGVGDNSDAFPNNPDESTDSDNDGVGDNADLDDDNDSVEDLSDAFPLDASESVDTDDDGVGNNADLDDDNDNVADSDDVFPLDPTESIDTDGDGVGDNADLDDDADGVEDVNDVFPLDANESLDTDGDGIGNNTDRDDDNDGYPDAATKLFAAGYYDFCVDTSAGLQCFGNRLDSSGIGLIPTTPGFNYGVGRQPQGLQA